MTHQDFFRKRLKIYENEIGVFLWLAAFFFLTFFVTAVFRNYVETAFLKRHGPESLPLMFVINGFLTIIVFKGLRKIEAGSGDHYLMAGIFLGYGAAVGGLFFVGPAGTNLIYPVLFQLLYLLDSLVIVYLWNISNALVNARTAGRLYPVLTAVTVAGGSSGGFLTEPLGAVLGYDRLLLFSAAVFVFLAMFLFLSSGRLKFQAREVRGETHEVKTREIPGLVRKYPILRYLIMVSFVPNILLPVFFYQFSVIANNTFGSEQALLAFLGSFRGGMTAVIFILLFFISSLYKKVGLARVSLVNPLTFFAIFVSFNFFFNIYVAAAGQFFIRLMQRAVSGPVNKIFFLVVPAEISAWSQVFVRGAVVNVGMIAGSLVLLLVKPVVEPREMALPAAGLALYLAAETLLFARRYGKSLKQAVIGRNIDYDSLDPREYWTNSMGSAGDFSVPGARVENQVSDREPAAEPLPVDAALELLNDPDEASRALAADSFAQTKYLPATRRLIDLLDDREVVRKAAMEALAVYPDCILPELESSLFRLSRRGQEGALEVMRLAGWRDFEETPYAAKLLAESCHNLMAADLLGKGPGSVGRDLLIRDLEETNDLLLTLIFQALGVKYADMRLIRQVLGSREAPVAVEMLEHTLDGPLAGCLVSLLDELPVEEKLKRARRFLPLMKNMTLERSIVYLTLRDEPATRMLTAFFLSETEAPTFSIAGEALLRDPDEAVRNTARYAVKCHNGETPPMPEILDAILFLKTCLVFDGLGTRELKAIASIAVRRSHGAKEVIVEQGSEDAFLRLIVAGRVNVVRKDEDGQAETLKTLGPTAFFGLVRLFAGGSSDESYIAAEPTSILEVNRFHFEEIMRLYPRIGINLCTFLALRLESVQVKYPGNVNI
ncbi:MAG: cyclic nucleotide-binding domain-containing protein [Pseudomonadota bacterium]